VESLSDNVVDVDDRFVVQWAKSVRVPVNVYGEVSSVPPVADVNHPLKV
jgi:hypothetical protein